MEEFGGQVMNVFKSARYIFIITMLLCSNCMSMFSSETEMWKFTLHILSPNGKSELVDIKITLDGEQIVRGKFFFEGPHHRYTFVRPLKEVPHRISVVALPDVSKLVEDFYVKTQLYAVLYYWYQSEKDEPHFEFMTASGDFGFM